MTNFDYIADPDVPDQLGQVRLMIARARISSNNNQNPQAHHTLWRALSLTMRYGTFPDGSYYQRVIYLFLVIINHRSRAYESGQSNLIRAQDIFHKQRPRFYMPGLGSYFLKDLQQRVRSLQWPEPRGE